jgi:hypothetical protein
MAMSGVGGNGMTKDDAVEKCVRAMLKRQCCNENQLRSSRMLPSVIGGPGGCLVLFDKFVGAR